MSRTSGQAQQDLGEGTARRFDWHNMHVHVPKQSLTGRADLAELGVTRNILAKPVCRRSAKGTGGGGVYSAARPNPLGTPNALVLVRVVTEGVHRIPVQGAVTYVFNDEADLDGALVFINTAPFFVELGHLPLYAL